MNFKIQNQHRTVKSRKNLIKYRRIRTQSEIRQKCRYDKRVCIRVNLRSVKPQTFAFGMIKEEHLLTPPRASGCFSEVGKNLTQNFGNERKRRFIARSLLSRASVDFLSLSLSFSPRPEKRTLLTRRPLRRPRERSRVALVRRDFIVRV